MVSIFRYFNFLSLEQEKHFNIFSFSARLQLLFPFNIAVFHFPTEPMTPKAARGWLITVQELEFPTTKKYRIHEWEKPL
jgi:hypothetical protein